MQTQTEAWLIQSLLLWRWHLKSTALWRRWLLSSRGNPVTLKQSFMCEAKPLHRVSRCGYALNFSHALRLWCIPRNPEQKDSQWKESIQAFILVERLQTVNTCSVDLLASTSSSWNPCVGIPTSAGTSLISVWSTAGSLVGLQSSRHPTERLTKQEAQLASSLILLRIHFCCSPYFITPRGPSPNPTWSLSWSWFLTFISFPFHLCI